MKYKIKKVYVVDANDTYEARRRVATDGDVYLELISLQEIGGPQATEASEEVSYLPRHFRTPSLPPAAS